MQIGPAVMLNDLLACDRFDVMAEVHSIKLPTLVICGRDDELTPVKYAHYLASQIEGSREVIVPGTAHWVLTEKPKAVNRAIESFLAELAGAQRVSAGRRAASAGAHRYCSPDSGNPGFPGF